MSKILGSSVLFLLSFVTLYAYAAGDCPVTIQERVVAGDSMLELFAPGTAIRIQEGWYACHPVERDDIVVIKFEYRARPIIKMARVLPGDRFRLIAFKDGYRMLVNDRVLATPNGAPYLFGGKGYKMLALYEESFRGVMPPETFFVFGTKIGGSLDSTRFGPIKKEQFVGRVK